MKTKPIKVEWDVDFPEDLGNLPMVVSVPSKLFEDVDAVSDYLSDEYGFCVLNWCELTDKEEIAYLCTQRINNYAEHANAAKQTMIETENSLVWVDDALYSAIEYQIGLYCKGTKKTPKDYDVNEIFSLTFNYFDNVVAVL